jgi:hypothetical protein
MDTLPKEIHNYLYKVRALCILRDHVTKYNLNFDRLCKFLIRFKGVIGGSFTLSCFDNTIQPNDIDIFVNRKSFKINTDTPTDDNTDTHVNIKVEFLKLIDHPNTIFGLDNQPLSNSSDESDKTERVMKFCGVGPKGMNKIDLVIVDEEIQRRHCDIDCSSILFDGTDWIFPAYIENDIEKFIFLKYSGVNPYKTYFSEIYDPWRFSTVDRLTEDLSRFELSRNTSKINQMMRPIYDYLINFYPEKTESETITETEIAILQSISTKHKFHDGGIYCPECDDIFKSIRQTGIFDKYLPKKYIPHFISCEYRYIVYNRENKWVDCTNNVLDVLNDEAYWRDPGITESTDYIDEAEDVRTLPYVSSLDEEPIDGQLSIKNDDYDDGENKYCPENVINLVQSFFPDSVINSSMREIDIKIFIKMFTIYKYWYRILKYISRGYLIWGILDAFKGIINDPLELQYKKQEL